MLRLLSSEVLILLGSKWIPYALLLAILLAGDDDDCKLSSRGSCPGRNRRIERIIIDRDNIFVDDTYLPLASRKLQNLLAFGVNVGSGYFI
jgi:hypothetical protein